LRLLIVGEAGSASCHTGVFPVRQTAILPSVDRGKDSRYANAGQTVQCGRPPDASRRFFRQPHPDRRSCAKPVPPAPCIFRR